MKWFLIISFTLFLLPGISMGQQNIEDSLNKIIAENKNDADVAKAYSALSYEYTRKDAAKSRAYTNAAIAIAHKINDTKRLSTSYSQLVYWFHNAGNSDSAEYYLNLAKDLAQHAIESEKVDINSNYYRSAALYFKKATEKDLTRYDKKRIGLENMQHRAIDIHAHLGVQSNPGEGITVTLRMPV